MPDSFLNTFPLTLSITGITFLIAGLWLKHLPPKKRNMLVGYRTGRSMKSQEAWDFAQVYGGKMLARSGYALLTVGVLGGIFPFDNYWLEFTLTMLFILGGAFAPIFFTERKLKRKFPED